MARLQLASIVDVSDAQFELSHLRDQLKHLESLRSAGPLDSDMEMLHQLLIMRRAELLYAEYGPDRRSRTLSPLQVAEARTIEAIEASSVASNS